MLEWCPHGVVYIVMCFVVRSIEALGSAASMTATSTIGAVTFPQHISTVMGSKHKFIKYNLKIFRN